MDQPNRIFYPYQYFGNSPYLVERDLSSCVQRLGDNTKSVVIDIHSAIAGKKEKRVAAYGLHFGEGCRHNEGGLLPGMEYRNQVGSSS